MGAAWRLSDGVEKAKGRTPLASGGARALVRDVQGYFEQETARR